MLGFSPVKKHAKSFNYTPRYYDPERERRAERRAELRGERAEDADKPYEPGQYLRTAHTIRAARRAEERSSRSKRRFGMLIMGMVLLLLLLSTLYPRIVAVLRMANNPSTTTAAVAPEQTQERRSEFDQSGISDVEWQQQSITVVPNDYSAE
jgi:hypothetical protein